MTIYTQSVKDSLAALDSSQDGLTPAQVAKRLKQHGPNTLPIRQEALWRKIIEPFRSVFVGILVLAVVISLMQQAVLDAIIISAIILISAVIYYVQRFSTERILRSLAKHTPQTVRVIRHKKIITTDATKLVPGDIIILAEGDRVPADGRVIESRGLRVDESQLTGESLPIDKQAGVLHRQKEIYEQTNMVFQGSFVIGGAAHVLITATAGSTEFGKIAQLSSEVPSTSPVQKKIDTLISQTIAITTAAALVAFALALYRGMDISDALRFVIALCVSAVPEGLPVAISIVLVFGMQRMAARKALVRSMRAIESIGTITTIATDKTGTLTKNRLTVKELWHPAGRTAIALRTLASAIILPSDESRMRDPLDTAFADYASKHGKAQRGNPMKLFQFEQSIAMSGTLHHHGSEYKLYVKGSPEKIIEKSDLTDNEREAAFMQLQRLAAGGSRVIALAHTTIKQELVSLGSLGRRERLVLDGLVAVADVLRPEARAAIATAKRAGITVRMITGDHFETAYHIGKELGLVTDRSQVFDSRTIAHMSDAALTRQLEDIRIFSRILPEHKHRLLTLLKRNHITAMTGDGVNDVPALTQAHIGIAMGSGSQIAQDAGDIILLDDNFRSVVTAIHEGRTIFANIKRMAVYLLSTNLGEVVVFIGSLVAGLPLPLSPVQILWVNLVTDTTMVIPLGLEPGEKRNMKQPPYKADAPLLSRFMLSRILIVALAMGALTLGMYIIFDAWHGHDYARTIAFCTLVTMQWASAFSARSDYEPLWRRIRKKNPSFYIGMLLAVGLQALAVFGPLGQLLHVTPVGLYDLAWVTLLAFIIPIIVIETHKWIGRRFFGKGSQRSHANRHYGR